MKKNVFSGRRFRHGSLSVTISIIVVVAVILFNAIFTTLASKYGWYIDMTDELIYTMSDAFVETVGDNFDAVNEKRAEKGEGPVKVEVIFCDEKDNIMESTYQRYVLETVLELERKFPESISVRYVNIFNNPTALNPYKMTENAYFNTETVIFASGTEYRTYYLEQFYGRSNNVLTKYIGERRIASAILTITQLESPIACITTNHGETENQALRNVLLDAGYDVRNINLLKEDIPEECRLVVCFEPTKDFSSAADSLSDVSEIKKVKEFLEKNKSRSFMVFASPDAPELKNLEEFLEMWGVVYDRTEVDGKMVGNTVKDEAESFKSDGLSIPAQYPKGGDLFGQEILFELMDKQPLVLFREAMPLLYPEYYITGTENETGNADEIMDYKIYNDGSNIRRSFNVFYSPTTSTTVCNGKTVGTLSGGDRYALMRVTQQTRTDFGSFDSLGPIDQSSYVVACGSKMFASTESLNSNVYGNYEVLMSFFRLFGREDVGADIPVTAFSDTTIDTLTESAKTTITVVLVATPAVIITAACAFVLIRRKYR